MSKGHNCGGLATASKPPSGIPVTSLHLDKGENQKGKKIKKTYGSGKVQFSKWREKKKQTQTNKKGKVKGK